jgi:hypothetical protein
MDRVLSFDSRVSNKNVGRPADGAQLDRATVAQTGSLPYRGLPIRKTFSILHGLPNAIRRHSRLPVGATRTGPASFGGIVELGSLHRALLIRR